MHFITVTELKARATQIVSEIETTREEVIVTKNGKPVVMMKHITDRAFALRRAKEPEQTRKERRGDVKKRTAKGNLPAG